MLTTFSGRRPSQMEMELRALIDLFRGEGVVSYLEIGAREGDTFHEIMRHLPAGALGVACDLHGGLWGKMGTRAKLERAADDLCRRGYRASTVFGSSQDQHVIEYTADNGPYDALLIDGDHTYDGVLADWKVYQHLAPIVAFHDIVGTGQREKVFNNPVEVPRLWSEIKASGQFRTLEFIAPGSAMGIGVVFTQTKDIIK